MKKIIIVLIVFFAYKGITYAQNEKLIGSWLVTKVEVDGKIYNPFQIMNYNQDGKMVMMGIEVGTWEYNKKDHSIATKSEFDKDFNGENKILKLSEKELVVLKDGAKVFYEKVDLNQISKENTSSGLIGTWKLSDDENSDAVNILTFKSPDDFDFIEKDYGSQSKTKGTWIFNKNDKSVILIGFSMQHLKGLNKIVKISTDILSLDNNGTVYTFKKEENQNVSIEKLTFTEDEFYTDDGDYKYEQDEEKLPWRLWSELKTSILNVNQLVYKYSKLIIGTTSFESKLLTANVDASMENEEFNIDNIFNGFDSYNVPEDTEFPSNEFGGYKKLYPLQESIFRVQGEETITTPAGTFNCTIVEAISGNGIKKLWMINDKLGVYAKIIEEDPNENFGHYYIYELQEIN